jgi:cation diffusion facilitator CzcD-associated flavoprotein CzcO
MKSAVDVAIVGAGFAGLGAAIQLLRSGRTNFVVFERAAEVGGTWRDNTYPGCACDVPSHLYSFSFAPNPRWSRTYSPQPEIQQYIKKTVEQFGLRSHIRFNTEIIRTEFQEEHGCWQLTDRAGQTTTARVVIGAIGPLNRPSIPRLPGIDTFAGRAFHSSNWDHTVDLTGKRVAVIGTGASAIQIVPELAKIAGQLSVYQRTAPYVVPRMDEPIGLATQRLFGQVPALQQLNRAWIYWFNELKGLGFIGNKTVARLAADEARKHREASINDPDLLRKVTPNYQLGCKRVLVSDEYYPALTRPNVSLTTDPIQAVTPTGIVTADGTEHPTDVIVYGTGFVAADIISDLTITGLDGRNLFENWLESGAEAYKGITVSGFPGLLFLVGPNTGLGHNSIIHMIESQVNYALDYLRLLDRAGEGAYLNVKPAVQSAYNERLQQDLQSTVWASGCQSWYMNAAGRNTTIWPKLTVDYRRETARADPADYEVVWARKSVTAEQLAP